MLHHLNPIVGYLTENKEGRDFVVGDIHGMTSLLGKILKHVEFDKTKDRLISVGDLVDRGTDNFGALKLLDQPWFHAVLGNHEDLARYSMLLALKQQGLDPEEYRKVDYQDLAEQKFLHIRNGGDWINQPEFTNAFCLEYIRKISAMPLILVVGKDAPHRYHVVHSEILSWDGKLVTNEYIDNLQHEADNVYGTQNFFWGRNMFGNPNMYTAITTGVIGKPSHPRWQDFQSVDLAWTYCGHTPKDLPMIVGRQINLDTCAFYASYIDKERNGTRGLTIADPKSWTYWTINGASDFISEGNLGDR
jgi:serine/threonine protein phosphatase 1